MLDFNEMVFYSAASVGRQGVRVVRLHAENRSSGNVTHERWEEVYTDKIQCRELKNDALTKESTTHGPTVLAK